MDGEECILVSIDTKKSMKQREIAKKSELFQRVLKMGKFWAKCKGGPFSKFSKLAIFLAELSLENS